MTSVYGWKRLLSPVSISPRRSLIGFIYTLQMDSWVVLMWPVPVCIITRYQILWLRRETYGNSPLIYSYQRNRRRPRLSWALSGLFLSPRLARSSSAASGSMCFGFFLGSLSLTSANCPSSYWYCLAMTPHSILLSAHTRHFIDRTLYIFFFCTQQLAIKIFLWLLFQKVYTIIVSLICCRWDNAEKRVPLSPAFTRR